MSDRPMYSQQQHYSSAEAQSPQAHKVSKATALVAVVAAVCLSLGVVFAAVDTNQVSSFLALSPTAVRTAGATRTGMAPVTVPRSTVRAAAGPQQVQATGATDATGASAQVYESESNAQFVNTAVDVESVSQEGSWFSSAFLAFLAPVAAVAGFFAYRSSQKSGYQAVESHPAWAMMATREKTVFDPLGEPKLETFSFLPPLTDQEIIKQVDYVIRNGWAPMLEFASDAITGDHNSNRIGAASGYYDNRYWAMWKLPMYGASDGSQVLNEIKQARQVYPDCFIRLVAFDNVTQTQISSLVVSRPSQPLKEGATGNRIPQVTDPFNATKFETFSYLPALTQDQIARQVQYMTDNDFTPCLEFAPANLAVVDDTAGVRFAKGASCGYQDNRYWTMWKLPMFGVQNPQQVLGEIQAVVRSYPECYVRLAGFDSKRQTQVTSMVVHTPEDATTAPPAYGAPVVRDVSVTNPLDGDKYETFSYLPALTDAELAKQVNYVISNKWIPCLEFATSDMSVVADDNTVRMGHTAGYYDNRYWTMWKLPMFGASDPYQVQREVEECKRAYPEAFVRMAAFDPERQVQVASFICQKPDPAAVKAAADRKVRGVSHAKARDVAVLDPVDNLKFETFSYLPAMNDQQIVSQVNYIVNQDWTPCLEFSPPEHAWVSSAAAGRFEGGAVCGYQDNRYWVMWKLPMYGCTDGRQVLFEIAEAKRAYPECYMRLVAFDSEKQVQSCGLMVSAPVNSSL